MVLTIVLYRRPSGDLAKELLERVLHRRRHDDDDDTRTRTGKSTVGLYYKYGVRVRTYWTTALVQYGVLVVGDKFETSIIPLPVLYSTVLVPAQYNVEVQVQVQVPVPVQYVALYYMYGP